MVVMRILRIMLSYPISFYLLLLGAALAFTA
jgi:hypothetical protein